MITGVFFFFHIFDKISSPHRLSRRSRLLFKDDEVTSEMKTPTHESDYWSSYLYLHTSLQQECRRACLKQRSAQNVSCSLNLMWKSKREYNPWLFHMSVFKTIMCYIWLYNVSAWSERRSNDIGLICGLEPCRDWWDEFCSGWVTVFWAELFFPSASVPGHEIKFGTSILDYPRGLWDTLIIENDSTWSEGQTGGKKKREGLNWALPPSVLSNFMVH